MFQVITYNVLAMLLLFFGEEGLVNPFFHLSFLPSRQLVAGELSELPLWAFSCLTPPSHLWLSTPDSLEAVVVSHG